MKRYFIVFYMYGNAVLSIGRTTDGEYISRKLFEEANTKRKIFNIIELSEEDYYTWIK